MTIEELRESETISLVLDGKYTPKDIDRTIRNMKSKIKELEHLRQLDMAEIVRLRRQIEAEVDA